MLIELKMLELVNMLKYLQYVQDVPCRTKWSLIMPTLKQQMTPEVSVSKIIFSLAQFR